MDNKLTLIYIIVFSAILILLRTIGVILFNDYEIIGYLLIIYGLSLFYSSYISRRKLLLFLGSSLFLAGVIFLLYGSFDLIDSHQILIPAILLTFSISSLMLFLYDKSSSTPIYSAVILFAGGIGAMALFSPYGLHNFINNIISFSEVFWPVVIILAAVVILVNRETRK